MGLDNFNKGTQKPSLAQQARNAIREAGKLTSNALGDKIPSTPGSFNAKAQELATALKKATPETDAELPKEYSDEDRKDGITAETNASYGFKVLDVAEKFIRAGKADETVKKLANELRLRANGLPR